MTAGSVAEPEVPAEVEYLPYSGVVPAAGDQKLRAEEAFRSRAAAAGSAARL